MGGGDREFLLSVFLMEGWDTLASIEDGITRLTASAQDSAGATSTAAVVEQLRVVTHRLKGAAAMNGFPTLASLAAAMEEAVDRAAVVETQPSALEALRAMTAALRTTLDTIGATGAEEALAVEAVLGGTSSAPTPTSPPARALDDLDRFFAANPDVLEYFIPEATEHLDAVAQSVLAVERDGANEAEMARLFRAVHTLKGAAYTVGCAPIGDLAHRIEDVLGEVREGRRTLDAPVLEVIFAGLDTLRLLVRTDAGVSPERSEALARVAGLLAALPAAGEAAPVVAAPTSEEPAVAESAAAAAASPTAVPAAARHREDEPREIQPSIRVNLDRLDALMNLVGELVIARGRLERDLGRLDDLGGLLNFTQARMGHTVSEFESKYHNPQRPRAPVPQDDVFGELEFDRYDDFNLLARRIREIANDVSEIEGELAAMVRAVREDAARVQQLSGELRGEITRARMVPIGRLFARFARQVREAARAEGKTVALEVQGETVEVDNTIVQQLADPLLHLIQNAVAHGIEPGDERQARGKTPHGTVRLSAAHRGGAIHVEIADDGRGIDVETVKQWALTRGFLTAEAAAVASDRDLLDLIFLPGFSTAASVTTTAGRGVGMDVVRTDVARLGGDIDVSTEIGVGTTFTLKLPLTVAVSDAVMVRVGTEVYAVAVSAVRATLRAHARDIETRDGIERVRVEDQMAELIPLGRVLGVPNGERPSVLPVVAVRAGRRTLAVAVDELLGKEEIVVKSLGRFLDGIGPFAGATVSPEGRVILLLDPLKLADMRSTEAPVPVPRPSEPIAVPTHRPRVLLVDDSVSVRKFVGQMLERAGFTVVTAIDGIEALERLAEAPANVIVTDLEMPRLNGYELVRDLKRRPATRDVPIIVLTTRAGEKHASLARELGVSHYATKPVQEEAFVRLVESLAMRAGMVA
jgi:chemosensory pili system protein ChpA (sensor histidine kinase/response regulator)